MARTRPLQRACVSECVPAVYLADCGWLILASADIFSCLDTGVRGTSGKLPRINGKSADEEPRNEAEGTAASSVCTENRLLLHTSRWRTHARAHTSVAPSSCSRRQSQQTTATSRNHLADARVRQRTRDYAPAAVPCAKSNRAR